MRRRIEKDGNAVEFRLRPDRDAISPDESSSYSTSVLLDDTVVRSLAVDDLITHHRLTDATTPTGGET
jgi:hypothetical protein